MDEDFKSALTALLAKTKESENVSKIVKEIVESVRAFGDKRVLELTARWDHLSANSMKDLEISRDCQQQALENLDSPVRQALESAVSRVKSYHSQQLEAFGNGKSWEYIDRDGNRLGQRVRGLEKVGLYVPGGKAAYPSTVYMTAIPAKMAGVSEVILVVPTPNGEVSQTLLAAARLCEIDKLFTIGGAQAIAALAFGTETIPRVDKIVGPGNIYVATAKELVYGAVDVDMVAGPSEIVIIADGSVRADWLALDMLAQAEHDEMAQAILISADRGLLDKVQEEVFSKLETMPRKQIISESLAKRSAMIEVDDIEQAVAIANRIAPEHLELAVESPNEIVDLIEHAGAIFLGAGTPEVVGDYTAGPSHVLPTSGTARFGSPLGVYDFLVKTSIIECSKQGLLSLNRDAAILAKEERLYAHASSAKLRLEN